MRPAPHRLHTDDQRVGVAAAPSVATGHELATFSSRKTLSLDSEEETDAKSADSACMKRIMADFHVDSAFKSLDGRYEVLIYSCVASGFGISKVTTDKLKNLKH